MLKEKVINWKWFRREWLFLLPSLLWIGMVAITTILWSDNRISSDWSAEIILAKEMLREGKLVVSDWHYSTEIRILYTQLFAIPMFFLFHSWDVIRAAQGCLLHLVLLLAYCFCMKPTKISDKWVYLSSIFLFIPFSYTYIDIVHMGQSYQPHMILCFLIIGMYLRLLEKRSGINMAGIIVLSFLCGLSGIRYLQILFLPLILAAIWVYYRSINGVMWAVCSMAFTAIGYCINEKLLHKWFYFGSYSGVKFAEFQEKNFLELLADKIGDWFLLFGYAGGEKVMSVAGVCNMLVIISVVILAYISYTVVRQQKKEDTKIRFVTVLFVSSLLVNTFVFLVLDNYYTTRYYILVFFWLPALLAIYLECGQQNKRIRYGICILLLGCLCLIGANTLNTLAQNDQNEDRKKVADFLEENQLTYGYATFWNADVITELTDGEVEVAAISGCEPFTVYDWLMPERYLQRDILKNMEGNQLFILLTWEEYEEYKESTVLKEAGEPVYAGNGYKVLLYDKEDFWQKYIEQSTK